MNTQINLINANLRRRELRRQADVSRRGRSADEARTVSRAGHVVRFAGPEDAADLIRLAQLEGLPIPAGDLLIAVSGGQVLAALPVGHGPALADPFQATAAIVSSLREERAHLRGDRRPAAAAASAAPSASSSARCRAPVQECPPRSATRGRLIR